MNLTIKQQRFVEEYLKDFNATQAAIRAGYSVKTAAEQGVRLLKYAKVKAVIDEGLKRMRDAALADAYEVERYLTAVMRGESSSEIVIVEGIGEGMSEARHVAKAPDEKERLKAAEILAKRHGLTDSRLTMTHLVPPVFIGEDELE